jgi:SAM-dependent methyltransferase
MLSNFQEYAAMHAVEKNHWWYKTLHRKVLKEIQNAGKQEPKILDAGCGTGGLMLFLKQEGFKYITGFDYSQFGVDFSLKNELSVIKADLLEIEKNYAAATFDIIVMNDVLYQFESSEVTKILLISNNQAFRAFAGTHDIAVGSKQRFTKVDFSKYLKNVGSLKIISSHYWSFFLSPLVFIVRTLQRLKLKLNMVDLKNIKSDVKEEAPFLNSLFFALLKLEDKLIKNAPFGSSLFLVFKKA